MHLNNLSIKNFRSMDSFTVSKLGRVNLIVGKNNSGKSTVLEALRIYANAASPSLLEEIAAGHDERVRPAEFDTSTESDELPYENFFTGRKYPTSNDTFISIGEADGDKNLVIRHEFSKLIEEETNDNGETVIKKKLVIINKESMNKIGEEYDSQGLHIIKNKHTLHILNIDNNQPRLKRTYGETTDIAPCSYIPTQFISMDELAAIWDNVQFSSHGDFVKEGLKVISDDFENLAFVNNETDFQRSIGTRKIGMQPSKRIAKVKLKGISKAVPLNSMGDGILRTLQLLLKIYPARGGFLLIDEFENGLHYSIQEKIWGYIFDLSKKLDIQVFATTHSWDCIESFAKVARDRTDSEGVLFRVGRSVRNSDQGKVIATVFDEDQLFNITQSDVEVR